MFDKNENDTINERVLFKGRPNFFFSCKTIFLLFMLLGFISFLAPVTLSFVAEIQVYLVNIINLPLTSYTSLIFIILFILIVIWIIWIFLNWKAKEYIITNLRIILKEGILIRKSHHMPFNHIQDISLSQGIFQKIVSIGHVTVVNAYDLTDIEFRDIHYPEEIQELIFNEMNKDYDRQNYRNNYHSDFRGSNERNQLRQDRHYQASKHFHQNQYSKSNFDDADFQYSKSNFDDVDLNHEDDYHDQIHNQDYDFNQGDFNKPYQKSNNLPNDFLDNSINEAMSNLDRNQSSTIEKSETDNYFSNKDISPNKSHDEKFHLKNHNENLIQDDNFHFENDDNINEENNLANNYEDENLSIIDIYSKKFKKR